MDDINILWDSVSKFKETNTSVSKIGYKLFISDNIENLKSASSCEKFLPEDVIVIDLNFDQSKSLDSKLAHKISVFLFLFRKIKSEKSLKEELRISTSIW